MMTTWWVWVVAGLLLLILEGVVSGFILLGFAVGTIVVGLLMWVGIVFSQSVTWLVFAIVSLVAWFVFRRVYGSFRGQVKVWDRDINDN